MKDETASSKGIEQPPKAVQKKPYFPPVIQVYGSVHALTRATGSGSGDTSSMMSSDINAKQNIVRIGMHPLGFGLYLFDYKAGFAERCGAGCRTGRQFGVMAQEVEPVMPAAVCKDADGYLRVDYAALGIHVVQH
jgi:hypothetical protein